MAKWTRDEIIRHILDRESAGLPLSLGGERGIESPLYQAASRIFGTWRNAVMAAGIAPHRALMHEQWSASKILAAIRTLCRRSRPLRQAELKKKYGPLVRAARRIFGSWSVAVAAAGVDPYKLRRFPPWTRQRIVEAILIRALRNEPLGSRTVDPRSLADAGTRVFGSWGAALAASGLDPGRFGYPGQNGNSATLDPNLTVPGNPIRCEASPDASSKTKASTSDPERASTLRWTNEAVVQAILSRLREHRRMNATAVANEKMGLYRAALRRFGSWRNALMAAGLAPSEFSGGVVARTAKVSTVSRIDTVETDRSSANSKT